MNCKRSRRFISYATTTNLKSSANFDSLPIVDVSDLMATSGSFRKQKKAALKIHEACRDVGFLYITGHGVSQKTLDSVLDVQNEFFALDLEEKKKIHMSKSSAKGRGYQHTGENVTDSKKDWHEAIDFMVEHSKNHPGVLEVCWRCICSKNF